MWTSHSCSSSRRTVSPAPPSKSTLSGTTTAARPLIFRMRLTCWTKLSCLLLVVAQKSSRYDGQRLADRSPSSLTISDARLLAERRIGQHHVVASPGSAASASGLDRRLASSAVAADAVQEQVHRAQAGDAVDELDAVQRLSAEVLLLVAVELVVCSAM